jgi:hypothetical protein
MRGKILLWRETMKKISSGNVIKKGRKKRIVVIVVVGVLLFTAPLIAPGLKMGWGPFSWLNQFDNTLQNEANAIKERYDAGIVFPFKLLQLNYMPL